MKKEIEEDLAQQTSKGKGESSKDHAPEPKVKHNVGGKGYPSKGCGEEMEHWWMLTSGGPAHKETRKRAPETLVEGAIAEGKEMVERQVMFSSVGDGRKVVLKEEGLCQLLEKVQDKEEKSKWHAELQDVELDFEAAHWYETFLDKVVEDARLRAMGYKDSLTVDGKVMNCF